MIINNARKSQNMIEVILIIPLLLVILFGIVEYAVFQRTVSAVQDIAEDAVVAASKYYVAPNVCNLSSPPAWCANGAPYDPTENSAVNAALNKILTRVHVLGGLQGVNFKFKDLRSAFGKRPFALYEFDATKTTTYRGQTVPVMILTVDYRDPMHEGVSTQLIYYYHLIIMGLKLQIPGRKITIIPDIVEISSTQTRDYVNY